MESKIPFYNLVNMFLIGIVFVSSASFVFYKQITEAVQAYPHLSAFAKDFPFIFSLIAIGLIYMTGLIINRFSSVAIEKFLILCKVISNYKKDYKDFNNCRKENAFLYTLSREYGLSRGNVGLWFLLSVLFFCFGHWLMGIISLGIMIIFVISMNKFSNKIHNVITDFKNDDKNEK